jgi:hypothetical protein
MLPAKSLHPDLSEAPIALITPSEPPTENSGRPVLHNVDSSQPQVARDRTELSTFRFPGGTVRTLGYRPGFLGLRAVAGQAGDSVSRWTTLQRAPT